MNSKNLLSHKSAGILYMIAAMALFSGMFALSKLLGQRYSPSQIAFLRFSFGLIPFLPIISRRGPSVCHTKRLWGHIWRAFFGLTSLVLQYYALQSLPLAEGTIAQSTSPMLIALFGVLLLREKPDYSILASIVLGFVGVVILSHPQDIKLDIGLAYALSGAALYALAMIGLRSLGSTENPLTSTIIFSLLSTLFTAPPAFFAWHSIETPDWLLFLGLGLLGGVGQLALTKAYALSTAATVAPFSYTSFLWATLYGVLIWNQLPDSKTLIGACFIVTSGILIRGNHLLKIKGAKKA